MPDLRKLPFQKNKRGSLFWSLDHFQQYKGQNKSIIIILSMNISKLVLGYIPQSLNRKDPDMIQYSLYFIDIR
jgi:hypothetical protein